jgi:putative NADH-flavin reductase
LKIALFGSTGRIGRRILDESLSRGHNVIAIVRDATAMQNQNAKVEYRTGDVLKPESVTVATKDADVVVSAYGPGAGDAAQITTAAKSLDEGVSANDGHARLIIVGGAGSLEAAPGTQLLDTPGFPPAYKKEAEAHRSALDVLKQSSVDWTVVSPSAEIHPGTRSGKYRVGRDALLVDGNGKSHISMEDLAAAILDEIEKPQFRRARFTVGY